MHLVGLLAEFPADTTRMLHVLIAGAIFSLSLVATLIFVRFYRRTQDRLFVLFACAFFIMGLNRLALIWTEPRQEFQTPLYIVRLLAHLLILYAIFDKNRSRKPN